MQDRCRVNAWSCTSGFVLDQSGTCALLLHYFSLFQQQPYCSVCISETLACVLPSAPISYCYNFCKSNVGRDTAGARGELMQTYCIIFCAYLNQFQKMWVKHDNIFPSVCFLCHCWPAVLEATSYIAFFFASHRVCVCQSGWECQLTAKMVTCGKRCLFMRTCLVKRTEWLHVTLFHAKSYPHTLTNPHSNHLNNVNSHISPRFFCKFSCVCPIFSQ